MAEFLRLISRKGGCLRTSWLWTFLGSLIKVSLNVVMEQRDRNSIKEFRVREQLHMKCISLIVHIFVIYNRLNIFMDRFVSREVYPQLLEIHIFERNTGFITIEKWHHRRTQLWDKAYLILHSSDNSQPPANLSSNPTALLKDIHYGGETIKRAAWYLKQLVHSPGPAVCITRDFLRLRRGKRDSSCPGLFQWASNKTCCLSNCPPTTASPGSLDPSVLRPGECHTTVITDGSWLNMFISFCISHFLCHCSVSAHWWVFESALHYHTHR